MDVKDRIKDRRTKLKLTQEQVAKGLEVSRVSVAQWETGVSVPRSKNMYELCEILGCSPEYLLYGKGGVEDKELKNMYKPKPIILWDKVEDLPEGQYTLVPKLDVVAAAGNGYVNSEFPVEETLLAFQTSWIKRSKAESTSLVIVEVRGDSMYPTMANNDTVLIDKSQNTVKNGKVYCFIHNNEVKIKRLHKVGDKLIIESDNKTLPEYKYPEELSGEDLSSVKIIGRVVNRSGSGGL